MPQRHGLLWSASQANALAGPPAAYLRALLAEGRIRERLERLVERPELARQREESLGLVESPVQRLKLGPEGVQPLQDRVELAVVEALPLGHGSILRSGGCPPARPAYDPRPRGPPRA